MQLICLSCGLNPLGSITARHPTALLQWNQVQNNMNEEHRVEILTGCVILLNMGMNGQVSQSKFEVGQICIIVSLEVWK